MLKSRLSFSRSTGLSIVLFASTILALSILEMSNVLDDFHSVATSSVMLTQTKDYNVSHHEDDESVGKKGSALYDGHQGEEESIQELQIKLRQAEEEHDGAHDDHGHDEDYHEDGGDDVKGKDRDINYNKDKYYDHDDVDGKYSDEYKDDDDDEVYDKGEEDVESTQNSDLSEEMSVGSDVKLPKTLLYITTHMTENHIWYLKACWPEAIRHSTILQNADVMVYFTPMKKMNTRESGLAVLQNTFQGNNLTIQEYPNLVYQTGAMTALTNAIQENWFDGYDWVIRVNPDVIIRDETFLLDTMLNDEGATGLVIDCWQNNQHYKKQNLTKFHTDFFMIKPDALSDTAFLNPEGNAEERFTADIWDTIVLEGGSRLIPNAHPLLQGCRAGEGRELLDTPITHFHFDKEDVRVPNFEWDEDDIEKFKCPIPFQQQDSFVSTT